MKIFLSILSVTFFLTTVSAQNATIKSSGSSSSLGRNIIAISPVQLMAMKHIDSQDNSDVGISVSYERISANEYFGFKLPVSFSLKSPYYYFMPTLKIYPFKQGPVKFAFGPQFYVATGQFEYSYTSYDYPITQEITQKYDRTQVGFLINTSVNFTVLKNLYIGLETGLGINYYDSNADNPKINYDNYYFKNGNDGNFYPAVHGNFSMGYRF